MDLARTFEAHLLVLHVINEPVDLRGFYAPHISFEQLERRLRVEQPACWNLSAKSCSVTYSNFETALTTGVPFEEILHMAKERAADLIVIGTHGRTGLDHLIFGSTAERVVRSALCPVLTIRVPER